jgi:polyisoprenoid-binding protein YceI
MSSRANVFSSSGRVAGIALFALFGLSASGAAAQAASWDIDGGHSNVGFSVRHLMVSNVRGTFKTVSGTVELDETDPSKAKVVATIDTKSVDTGDVKRDEHLRSPDFFDSAKNPQMTFTSKSVKRAGKGWKVTGDLTIRGVTKEVVLDVSALAPSVKDPWGGVRTGFTATTTIDRKDYGMEWNKALDNGGIALGNEVKITLEIELSKKAPTTAAKN